MIPTFLALASVAGAQTLLSTVGMPPEADPCLRVPTGEALVIDVNGLDVERLEVTGAVGFAGGMGPFSFTASEISVHTQGLLQAGTSPTTPYNGDLSIYLRTARACGATYELQGGAWVSVASVGTGMRDQVLHVGDGTLKLYGAVPSPTWTELAATANPADPTIAVMDALSPEWDLQDVQLAPTGFLLDERSQVQATVDSLDPYTLNVSSWDPVAYQHIAGTVTQPGTPSMEVRGEVYSLYRGIRILGEPTPIDIERQDCTAYLDDPLYYSSLPISTHPSIRSDARHLEFDGAEVMIMPPDEHTALVEMSGVAVVDGGKFDRLGQYPIHFHRAGDMTGSFLYDVLVHHSANRGIVLHGTQNVAVENSVVADVVGHGFYLEEEPCGSCDPATFDKRTADNTLRHNLAVEVHGCPAIEDPNPLPGEEDIEIDHDVNASGFFFTDPRNVFEDNRAAGALGAGFWFDSSKKQNDFNLCGEWGMTGPTALTADPMVPVDLAKWDGDYANAELDGGLTCHGAFVGNQAHGAEYGMFGERNMPAKDQLVRLRDLSVWKNRRYGLKWRNYGVTEVLGLQATDNPIAVWPGSHATHGSSRPRFLLAGAAIWGEAVHYATSTPLVFPPVGGAQIPFYGVSIYEGHMLVTDTFFDGYVPLTWPPDPFTVGMRAAIGRHQNFPFYTNDPNNGIDRITFGPTPGMQKIFFDPPRLDTREPLSMAWRDGMGGFQHVMVRDWNGDIATTAGNWLIPHEPFLSPPPLPTMTAPDGIPVPGTYQSVFEVPDASYGQVLLEWCMTPGDAGSPRCQTWYDWTAMLPVPSNGWGDPIPKNGWDAILGVEFEVRGQINDSAPTLPQQGHHKSRGTNVMTEEDVLVRFMDAKTGGSPHDAAGLADLKALHVRWRQAPLATDSIEVIVPGPAAPVCHCALVGMKELPALTGCNVCQEVGSNQTRVSLTAGGPNVDTGNPATSLYDEESCLLIYDLANPDWQAGEAAVGTCPASCGGPPPACP